MVVLLKSRIKKMEFLKWNNKSLLMGQNFSWKIVHCPPHNASCNSWCFLRRTFCVQLHSSVYKALISWGIVYSRQTFLSLTRGKKSSAMQRCAKDQPETLRQHSRHLPPLLLPQTTSHCKSSRSIQSSNLGSTPGKLQRNQKINAPLGNLHATSEGRQVILEREVQD